MTLPASLHDDLQKSARALRKVSPSFALWLGTGPFDSSDWLETPLVIPCAEIPGFPACYRGFSLKAGEAEGGSVVVLEGSPLAPERPAAAELAYPVWLFAQIGVQVLILTGAGGSLRPRIRTGSLLVVEDQLNFTGQNPLWGLRDERLGPLFPDLSQVYDRRLASLAVRIGRRRRLPVRSGVLASTAGPSLETRAERRHLRNAGADAVAHSMAIEAIAAAHAGLRTAGILAILDQAWPVRKPVSVEGMLVASEEAAPKLERLVGELVRELGK